MSLIAVDDIISVMAFASDLINYTYWSLLLAAYNLHLRWSW